MLTNADLNRIRNLLRKSKVQTARSDCELIVLVKLVDSLLDRVDKLEKQVKDLEDDE